jgi:hypothetical protein
VFQTPRGLIEGNFHGAKNRSDTKRVLAKDGYAVGGITCAVDSVANRRIKVTFMKIRRLGLDVNDAYQTEWFGEFGRTIIVDLKSTGGFVIGIEGSSGEGLDSIGLVNVGPKVMPCKSLDSTITLQSDFKTKNSCIVIETNDGILIGSNQKLDGQAIQTIKSFKSPVSIKAKVKPIGSNVRFHYGKGMIIFNWEVRPRELRIHCPGLSKKQKGTGVQGKGHLSRDAWHDIEWRIENDRMTVWADGELRSESVRSFPELNSPLAIGSALDGSFILESLSITELTPPIQTTSLRLPDGDATGRIQMMPPKTKQSDLARQRQAEEPAKPSRVQEGSGQNQPLRIWKDAKGNVFEGEMITEMGDKVCLRGKDGNSLKIPFSDLSKQDQNFVTANRRPNLKIDLGRVKEKFDRTYYNYDHVRYEVRGIVKISNESMYDPVLPLNMHVFFFSESDELVRHEHEENIQFTGHKKEYEYETSVMRFYEDSSTENNSMVYGGYLVLVVDTMDRIVAKKCTNEKAEKKLTKLLEYGKGKIKHDSKLPFRELQSASPAARL